MKFVKSFVAICGYLLLAACSSKMESDAKEAVLKAIPNDAGKIKFGKFTQVDDKYACFAVDTGEDVGRQYILLKSNNKWEVSRAPIVSHEKCIQEAKEEYAAHTERLAGEARQAAEENDIKKVILSQLIDPDSAKFGKIKHLKRIENGVIEERACAVVNARNTYGGYTGDKVLMLRKVGNEWKSQNPYLYMSGYPAIDDAIIKEYCTTNIAY